MATTRRISRGLVTALLAATAVGCATSSGVDATEPVDYRQRAEALPIGEQTVAVASMHPERVDELAERDRDVMAEWLGVDNEAPAPHLASRAMAALFQSLARVPAAIDWTETDFRFEEIDRSGRIYFAWTARGHRQTLHDLEMAKPHPEEEVTRRGRLFRLLVPADDPAALVEEFEAHCDEETDEWMGGDCGAVVRFAAVGDYAVADLYDGPDDDESRQAMVSALPEDPAAPSGYLERLTPAARAFVGRRSAIGVYAQTDDLWKMTVLERLAEGIDGEDDEGADDDVSAILRRIRGEDSPYVGLVRQAALAAPGTREYEDLAVLHGYDDGHVVDAVRSFTDRGHRLAEAGRIDTKLPRLAMGDATLTVEWAFDAPSALRLAVVPDVLSREINRVGGYEDGWRLDRYDGLARMTPLVSYPVALAKFLTSISYGYLPTRTDALTRLGGVRALRVALDIAPSEESPFGVEFSGAAVAEVPRESNLDATVETAVAMARGVGLPVRMAANYQGDQIQLKVTINASMSVFGKPSRVGDGRIAQLDLGQLAARFEDDEAPAELGIEIPEEPETAGHLEVEQTSNANGRGLRLRFGAEQGPSFSIPTSGVALASPSVPPECARRAVVSARRLLANGSGRNLDMSVFDEALPNLIRHAERCGDEPEWGERVASVAAANLVLFGDAKRRIGEWRQAETHFRRACEFGAETACRKADAAATKAGRLHLPDVGHTFALRGALPESVIEMSRDGVQIGEREPIALERLSGKADEGPSMIAAIEEEVGPTVMKTVRGFRVAVPMVAEESLSSRSIKQMARKAFETSVDRTPARGPRRGRTPHEVGKTEEIIFFVREPERSRRRRMGPNIVAIRRGGRTEASSDDGIGASIEVTQSGFEVSSQHGGVDPIEGCPDDGPTICLADGETLSESLDAYREADQKGDEAAAREAADRVASAYQYHRLYEVLVDLHAEHVDEESYRTPIRLAIDGDLPFSVMAKTIATSVQRSWNVSRYPTAAAMFDDTRRSRPMFEQIYLDLDE